jgi:AcrR family transcriptional regulator
LRKNAAAAREAIIAGALELIASVGGDGFTVDAVASRVGCAKGLVHYHFKTKDGLVAALADQIVAARIDRWRRRIAESQPEDAILSSWSLLTEESGSGAVRAWAAVLGEASPLPDHRVRELVKRLSDGLGAVGVDLLHRLGMRPRIPAPELGWILTSVVLGMGALLGHGFPPSELEGAYAAAWLGVLSLADER